MLDIDNIACVRAYIGGVSIDRQGGSPGGNGDLLRICSGLDEQALSRC